MCAVQGLGRKLRALRKARRLNGPSIAVRALGETSSTKQRRSLANYLSRIERGKMINPSLKVLEQLALGFGETSVGQFLVALEADDRPVAASELMNPPEKSQAIALKSIPDVVKDAASYRESGAGGADAQTPTIIEDQLERHAARFAKVLVDFVEGRVAPSQQPIAAPRRPRPKGRRRVRPRKSQGS